MTTVKEAFWRMFLFNWITHRSSVTLSYVGNLNWSDWGKSVVREVFCQVFETDTKLPDPNYLVSGMGTFRGWMIANSSKPYRVHWRYSPCSCLYLTRQRRMQFTPLYWIVATSQLTNTSSPTLMTQLRVNHCSMPPVLRNPPFEQLEFQQHRPWIRN